MNKWLVIAILLLSCICLTLFLLRPSRPTIYYQPPSVTQADIAFIQRLVRAGGDRRFRYIVFSTVDTNQVQVCVRGGVFHRDRSRLYWIRRVGQTWQVERVDPWEDALPRM